MRDNNYNILAEFIKRYSVIFLVFCGTVFSQDAPEEFDFNISIYQSFYFFINSDIDGEPLVEDEDWIASFNEYDETMGGLCEYIGQEVDGDEFTSDCQDVNSDGVLSNSVDVCVGSYFWSGEYTTVPVMGNDGTTWTVGYMEQNEYPKFKIYDASEGAIYDAIPSVVYPWSTDLAFYVINISVIRDCYGDLGGDAFVDDCGSCVEGNTGLLENYLDVGCGCGNPLVGPFYSDEDGDGLGSGQELYFCSHPGTGWSTNDNDPFPSCNYNFFDCNDTCGGTALVDDCGVCSGGDTGLEPNANLDCNNECFGFAYVDDCDQCVGGSTGLEPCDFQSNQPEEFFYYQSTLQAFYYIVDAFYINGDYLSTQDWIGVFNGDICVGSIKWDGPFTTVPTMGDDGSEWTDGYMNMGDYPTFRVYDASVGEFYDTQISEIVEISGAEEVPYTGWGINDFYYIYGFVAQSPDCNGDVGGLASFDDCGVCSGGDTGIVANADLDCAGTCFGDAYLDNCNVCADGTSGNTPNVDDSGCGCFLAGPEDYYADADGDGFGYGDTQSFCDEPGDGWVQNNFDQEPFCYNDDTDDINIDDCGICNGNNESFDCAGVCFGGSELDDCGICDGDNGSCQSPTADNLSLSTNEDEELLIELSGTNPIDSELNFVIIDAPEHGVLFGPSENFFDYTYTPNHNYNGYDSFTYMSFNGEFYSDVATVLITINSVNDAPTAQDIITLALEDSTVTAQVLGFDVDGDDLSYTIVSHPVNGYAELNGDVVTYIPNDNYFGIEIIGYISDDGNLQSELAYISIYLEPVNDAPVAQDMDITFNEDETHSFMFDVSDVDNDSDDLSIIFVSEIEFGIVTLSGTSATILPHSDISGDFTLEYKVLDGSLFSEDATLSVHILPINDAPEMSIILNQSVYEDETFNYQINVSDIDSDDLSYSVNNIENSTEYIVDQMLTVIPEPNFNGTLDVIIMVSDGEYVAQQSFLLHVIPVNDSPVLAEIENQLSLEDEIFNLDIFADDIDGDELFFWSNGIENGDISIEGNSLSIIPNHNWNGDINVVVNVTDGEYADSQIFVLTVNPVNDAPSLADIDNQFIDEDTSLIYTLDATDVDGDDFVFSVSVDNNAQAYISDNILEVIPTLNFFGNLSIDITVSDAELSDTESFTLEVFPINDPPTLEYIENQEMYENTTLIIEIEASDVDGDELTYDSYILDGFGQLEIEGDSLIINPMPSWYGQIFLNFIINDGEYYVFQEIQIDVIEIDDPPVSFDVSSTLSEDDEYYIQLLASDSDSEDLTFSLDSYPTHGTVSLDGSIAHYIPESNYNGADEFLYMVSDGTSFSNVSTSSINVIPINDAPTSQDIEYSISNGFVEFDLNEVINDIDGDQLEVMFITQNYGSDTIETLFSGTINSLGDNVFSYTAPEEMVYFDFILYKVSDGFSESTINTITFNLLGREMTRDMAPIAFDQDVNVLEDNPSAITLIGFDVLNAFTESASFEITSAPSNGTLSDNVTVVESGTPSLVQWLIEYTPDTNFYGQDSFTYKVTNPENSIPESEDGTIYINISPQNDAPIVYNNIFNQTLTEDAEGNEFSLSLFFIDVDEDVLIYSVNSTNTDVVDIDVSDGNLSITPIADQNASPFSVSITASDGELDVTQTFTVEVTPVNDPPTAESAEYQTDEDVPVPIVYYGYDIEFDPLTFIINEQPSNGSVVGDDNNVIRYIPDNNYNGTDSFTFVSNDGQYSSDPATISIEISAVNDPPSIEEIEDYTIDEDTYLEITLIGSDVDGDSLFYIISTDETVESIEVIDNLLSITPLADMFGEIHVDVVATDGLLQDSDSFTVNVMNVNDPPNFADILDQENNEDEDIVITLNATDVDGDDIEFSASSDINNTEISIENNLLFINPPANFFGNMVITAVASDGIIDVTQNFNINFIAQPDAPQIAEIPDQEILEGEELNIYISVYDPDGDQIVLSLELSEEIDATIDNFNIIFQTQSNASGDYEVVVTASDGLLSDQESFVLTVININDPPVSYSDNITLDEDNSVIFSLIASDPDFDQLSYFIDSNPAHGSIEVTGGLVTYNPSINYFGEDSLTFYASDSELNSNISTVHITILPINDGPVITSTPSSTATEDELYTYQIIAVDPENDSLSYVLDAYPLGMDISNSGLITWTPLEGVVTSGYIRIVVSDGGEDGALPFTQNFVIEVEPVNDRPTIMSEPNLYAYEDQQYTYQIEVYDPDSDIFYYSLLIGPSGMGLSEDGLITWTPTEGITSSGTVAFVVWDVEFPDPTIDLPAIQEFVVQVYPVNDPPSIVSTPITNAIEDIEYQYQVVAEDIDDDLFYFVLLEHPAGMDINQNTGMITWTPLEGVLSSGNITVTVFDGLEENALSAIQNFLVIVTPVNDPPVIVSTAPSTGTQGEEYLYAIEVDDPDDTLFTYLLFDAPDGMTIDFNTGVLSWTPIYGGVYGPIILRVQDGGVDFAMPSDEVFVINVQYSSGPTTVVIPLHAEYNLISYPAIPEDDSVENVLSDLGFQVTSIITEGLASTQLADGWYGSISYIDPSKGYWLRAPDDENMEEDTIYHVITDAIHTPQNYVYSIHEDYNLISYIGVDGVLISDALPDDFEESISSVIGEGTATIKLSDGWYGSLEAFYRNKGYWVRSQSEDTLYFSWNIPDQETLFLNMPIKKENIIIPENLSYRQSSRQSFYFVENILLENEVKVTNNDWVVAYNGNTIIGSRKWNGRYTDIPAMGFDGTDMTLGYCRDGDVPSFKLYIENTGEFIELESENIAVWSDLSTNIVSRLTESIPLPEFFEFSYPYPNPFNPSTLIRFSLPNYSNVKINAYDILGKEVSVILDKNLEAGYYDFNWNPGVLSSGIYFINIETENNNLTHKVMYIK